MFLMELEEVMEAQVVELVMKQEEVCEVEEQGATVSLNSLLGNVYNVGNTMRLKGMSGQKTLHILIDTGSSHNSLSNEFCKISSNVVKETKPLQVTVVDGGKIMRSKMIEGFKWAMQGHGFSTDVILFPLSGCDLILGMQWLRTLGPLHGTTSS